MSEQKTPEPAEEHPKAVPDETDDPDYPDTVEGTGSQRDDEPVLDEPIER
ncbi:MAG: hypothetical protein ABIN55_03490 [Aeromicrobium sp.]